MDGSKNTNLCFLSNLPSLHNPNAHQMCIRDRVLIKAVDEAEYLGAGGIAFLAGKWEQDTKDLAYEQLLKTTRSVCTLSLIHI